MDGSRQATPETAVTIIKNSYSVFAQPAIGGESLACIKKKPNTYKMHSQIVQLICTIFKATGFEKKASNHLGFYTPLFIFFTGQGSPQNGVESIQRPNAQVDLYF